MRDRDTTTPPSALRQLPGEIWVKIIGYLVRDNIKTASRTEHDIVHQDDLIRAIQVNHNWYKITAPILYRCVVVRDLDSLMRGASIEPSTAYFSPSKIDLLNLVQHIEIIWVPSRIRPNFTQAVDIMGSSTTCFQNVKNFINSFPSEQELFPEELAIQSLILSHCRTSCDDMPMLLHTNGFSQPIQGPDIIRDVENHIHNVHLGDDVSADYFFAYRSPIPGTITRLDLRAQADRRPHKIRGLRSFAARHHLCAADAVEHTGRLEVYGLTTPLSCCSHCPCNRGDDNQPPQIRMQAKVCRSNSMDSSQGEWEPTTATQDLDLGTQETIPIGAHHVETANLDRGSLSLGEGDLCSEQRDIDRGKAFSEREESRKQTQEQFKDSLRIGNSGKPLSCKACHLAMRPCLPSQ